MSNHYLAAAVVAALLPSVHAQDYFVPDNAASGHCNLIPFGLGTLSTTWSNQIYQTMATAADLNNQPDLNICDISFISCRTGLNVNHYDSIEIKLGQTDAASLSSTFSANMVTNVQTVLSGKNFDWHNTGGQFSRIGLQKSYLYIAGSHKNLVLQVCVTGGRKLVGGTTGHYTGSRQRLYNFLWGASTTCPTTGTLGSDLALKWGIHVSTAGLNEYGFWCKGSSGDPALKLSGSAKLGQNLTISLANGPATRPIWLAVGLSNINGGFDLGLIGATGCRMYVNGPVVIAAASSGSGTYSVQAQVPNNTALICTRVFTQFYCVDPNANGAGLTSTNYGLITAGN